MYWLRQAVLISFKDTTQWRRDVWGFVLTLGFPMAFATAFFFFLTPVFEEVAQDSGPPTVTITTQETSETALSRLIIAWMSSDQDPERPAVEYVDFDDASQRLADRRIARVHSLSGGLHGRRDDGPRKRDKRPHNRGSRSRCVARCRCRISGERTWATGGRTLSSG